MFVYVYLSSMQFVKETIIFTFVFMYLWIQICKYKTEYRNMLLHIYKYTYRRLLR